MASCFVSYLDTEGIRHSVEVEAGSLYEAAALAAATLKKHECAPADTGNLEIDIRSSVTHTITLKKVRQWLAGGEFQLMRDLTPFSNYGGAFSGYGVAISIYGGTEKTLLFSIEIIEAHA
jgi:hypothetical protein